MHVLRCTCVFSLAAVATTLGAALPIAPSFAASAQAEPATRAAPTYVGSASCAACHTSAYDAWRDSQHERAMQQATANSVLGNFNDARFTRRGTTSRFFRRGGRYFVNTDGPDGKLADFEVKYTFGVYPLQQYLIELPRGRLQALGVAWDARPKNEGGQRWFHLYPERKLEAGDPLHWTGIDQTWNYQCADCHSTDVRKNYDEAARAYRTTWSEISVGCEACHGPGSNHLAWAKLDAGARGADGTKGLTVALDERAGVTWSIDGASGNAVRSRQRTSNREIDTCARCHSRRGEFSDAWHPGQPIGDAFHVALIEPGLYYADGQMRDEVYNYGSFLQSRMHAMGVTCSDCHEPHSGKLRASGNAVCATCHAAARYEAAPHHHHRQGSAGAACVSCHMPARTYMVVDPRHDHSMRIPRPDRTLGLGTPDACAQCHAKQGAKWAADAVARWFPDRKPGFQTFAEALAAGERGAPGAQARLAALVQDAAQPAFARASAMTLLARYPSPAALPALAKALQDPDPLVRRAAAHALRDADPAARAKLLPKLLSDAVRDVRMEAARSLAGPPERALGSEDERMWFAKALEEYVAALRFNADRPEALAELGNLQAARGNAEEAIADYRQALALDPTFAPAAVNLADILRRSGSEQEAERVLRDAMKANPDAAAARHALGLSLARQRRMPEALAALAEAARLAPDDARFAYVYAVALHDAGQRAAATKALERALARNPYDRDILFALATYDREAGEIGRAAQRAQLLARLEPDNRELGRFAQDLAQAAGAAPRRP